MKQVPKMKRGNGFSTSRGTTLSSPMIALLNQLAGLTHRFNAKAKHHTMQKERLVVVWQEKPMKTMTAIRV